LIEGTPSFSLRWNGGGLGLGILAKLGDYRRRMKVQW
jgi:hypothetical protein